jgi:hypothetical protein
MPCGGWKQGFAGQRDLELNPGVWQRWRREFGQGPGNAFPGNGQRRWSEVKSANWNRPNSEKCANRNPARWSNRLIAHRETSYQRRFLM